MGARICMSFVFMLLVLLGTALVLVSFITSAWKVPKSADEAADQKQQIQQSMGFFFCGGDFTTVNCTKSFLEKPVWEQTVIVSLVMSLACGVLAFAWSWVACLSCCCKRCLSQPLPFLSGLGTIFGSVAAVVFAIKSGDEEGWKEFQFGYSFYMGIAGCGAMFLAMVVGLCLVRSARKAEEEDDEEEED